MSAELIARIRKNRELKVVVGGFTFSARRPTDVEMLGLHQNDATFSRMAQDFVIGWKGVTENDVVGGGGSDEVAFDVALWREWCADRPEFWEPIASALLDAYRQHNKSSEELEKN